MIYPATSKPCTKCKEVKPFEDFHKDCSRKDGLALNCKQCKNQQRQLQRDRQRKDSPEDTYLEWRQQIFAPELVTWERKLKDLSDRGIDITVMTAGEVDDILRINHG